MHKFIFAFCTLLVIACKNQTSTTTQHDSTVTTATTPTPTAPLKEDEMDFIAGCVENAKGRFGESGAFTLCKCILGQIQEKYPGADSAAIITHFSDTAELAKMVLKCQ